MQSRIVWEDHRVQRLLKPPARSPEEEFAVTTQMLWIMFVVFLAGLFIGSNLGVLLMCVLQVAGGDEVPSERLASLPVSAED
jgi:hypothetical protein